MCLPADVCFPVPPLLQKSFFFPSPAPPHYRQHPRGPKGPVLHRPVRPGAHQAARHPPHAVRGALLPRPLAHPQDGAGGVPPVPPVRHPGPFQERHLRGGERRDARHRRGPVQHAHQDGERACGKMTGFFYFFGSVKRQLSCAASTLTRAVASAGTSPLWCECCATRFQRTR